MKKNPQFKEGFIELDIIAKRYNLNPAELICEDEEVGSLFKLSLLRKIAQLGVEHESEQYEKAQAEANLQQRR